MKHVGLLRQLARLHPELDDPAAAVTAGRVTVAGRVITNVAARVAVADPIVVAGDLPLRGEAKLRGALDRFGVAVTGRVAMDLGASAGGFVRVLLDHGARRVYAVDAGHGQLLGSLRQDDRVVNLENTNLGALTDRLVPEPLDLITVDLSYLSLTSALGQLGEVTIAPGADLVALVKPMFELALPKAPTDEPTVLRAVETACAGVTASGWTVEATAPSPVTGRHGAVEHLLWASRPG